MGARVSVVFASDRRPAIAVDAATSLGTDQKSGLTLEDHRALDDILFGDDEEDDEGCEEDFGSERGA